MHPIKSIEARIQGYSLSHFKNSNYARKLRKFKDIHKGESCFIVGNGPSLREEDLEILHKKNIPCFAFNRIYLLFDKTNWRPTYYVSQDEKTLLNCINEVNMLDLKYKFIPLKLKYYNNIRINKALYFNSEEGYVDGKYEFSKDVSQIVKLSTTVAHTAAQIAAYMGFKNIYFIGIDHNFSVYKGKNGEIISNNTVSDYFDNDYNHDRSDLYIPNLDRSTEAFVSVREFCIENEINVFNSTRGGKLEVFPRVCFDDLFK